MGLNSFRGRPKKSGGGPPAWLIFLVAGALVFGGFYLFQGAQNFLRTGGLGVQEATARAQIVASATAVRLPTQTAVGGATLRPSATPIPECLDFRVTAANAIVRDAPSFSAATVTGYNAGTIVCVLSHEGEWYAIDTDTDTRRPELAYMHETVIEAMDPTLTPTRTYTPLPTVTPMPSLSPAPTQTPDPAMVPTETPMDARSTLPPGGN